MFYNGVSNSLHRTGGSSLCKLFGIRLVTNPAIVYLAKNAGFDALFIELEHSTLSVDDASRLCMAALLNGITPFVRVPYQSGYGVVQQVLDGGAMGVIFPHIHNKEDAEAAMRICKYPPQGCRSMTGQLPLFGMAPTSIATITEETNKHGSSVILMIETKESIEKADEIASVEGVDALLIGSNDLSIELGVPGDFRSEKYRSALERVSAACKKHGKFMGLAGIYDQPELQTWAITELGVCFILGQQDSGLLANGGKKCVEALSQIPSPN
ncbi:Phosphoenolpyruvate/pyruvate domain-containing protein [Thozetella sp. PMI_491]|nr:Phosphoenolpyruvate/pyruvate domain-containing protein [Thozetella sp. PMI_491]